MTYSVRLTANAAAELRAALEGFPVRDARAAIIARLAALGRNPSLGTRMPHGPLEGRMAYAFRVSWPPLTRQFTVFYQYDQDERTL